MNDRFFNASLRLLCSKKHTVNNGRYNLLADKSTNFNLHGSLTSNLCVKIYISRLNCSIMLFLVAVSICTTGEMSNKNLKEGRKL